MRTTGSPLIQRSFRLHSRAIDDVIAGGRQRESTDCARDTTSAPVDATATSRLALLPLSLPTPTSLPNNLQHQPCSLPLPPYLLPAARTSSPVSPAERIAPLRRPLRTHLRLLAPRPPLPPLLQTLTSFSSANGLHTVDPCRPARAAPQPSTHLLLHFETLDLPPSLPRPPPSPRRTFPRTT